MKKTIVHVIDSFGRGGAETMLVALLPELNEIYNVVLVTLKDEGDFEDNQVATYKRYHLGYRSKADLFKAVFRLKKIIRDHRPVLVRTQLFWSTIVGRLATPSKIPFLFSVHSLLSLDAFTGNSFFYWIEKLSYRKRHMLIAVSSAVADDYNNTIGIKGDYFILNNFVHPIFFQQDYSFIGNAAGLKLVAVGNLKEAKNYYFLLNVIRSVKDRINISVDIIGEGHLREGLQQFIKQYNLPVNLLGKRKDVHALLSQYDAYIMCSLHEGFGNSPIEAMAVGLPLILNDSDTMKEMSKGNAVFYESGNEAELENTLINVQADQHKLEQLSKAGKVIARNYYTRERYIGRLHEIYSKYQTG